jgi:hypothetical protein
MIMNLCQCRKLTRVVVGGLEFLNLRCPHCIDSIIESKNELVREVARLKPLAGPSQIPKADNSPRM